MRTMNKLTAKTVTRLTTPGRYADGGGLYLQVSKFETKSWIFRFMRDGRAREMGLGSISTVTLLRARETARLCRESLLAGADPIEARNAAKVERRIEKGRSITFKECSEKLIAGREAEWKNAIHRLQWKRTLETYAYPIIGALPVASIDVPQILKVLEPIWSEKNETASRLRGRIEAVLNWATVRKYRSGENPARWRGHLEHVLQRPSKVRTVRNHPALPYAELPQFMRELRGRKDISSRALEFTVLTAARTGEVIGFRRSEVDFSAKIWTVPAERMKAKKAHIVPLSERALEIIKSTEGDFVFGGANALSNMAMLELLKGMRPGFTVHGFRSTFRDWAGDCTNYPREVVEAALAHTVEDETEAAYRRSTAVEKRRRLMTEWMRYCASPVRRESAKVVQLHRRPK